MAEKIEISRISTEAVLAYFETADARLTSQIIAGLIEADVARAENMQKMYDIYEGERLRINDKTAIAHRPNNKLANDFAGEVIDQKVGYSFGNPVSYAVIKTADTEKIVEETQIKLDGFLAENNIKHLDTKTALYMSACGYAYRLLYFDLAKNLRTAHIDPWEIIVLRNQSTDEVEYVLRYYMMEKTDEVGKTDSYIYVEWYDRTTVSFYYQTGAGNFVSDNDNPPKPHAFAGVPIVEYKNKITGKGDFEKVISLIEAYDNIMSFNQDEAEDFRNAYLATMGMRVDQENIEQLRKSGAINLPPDGDAKFLIKTINDTFVSNHLKRLEENIYRFAKTVNMSDEKFSGSGQSGESRKWKLKALADDAVLKEAGFEKACLEMFKLISMTKERLWSSFSDKISIEFTNSIPVDLGYHADVTTKLKGNISETTRLSLLPFVDSVEQEIEQMEAEYQQSFEAMQALNDEEDDEE